MDCLKNVIGITRNECECFTGNFTEEEKAEMRISNSGLYLDELQGLPKLADIRESLICKDYVNEAKTAIENAIKQTYDDVLISLAEKYKTSKKKYIGSIGQSSFFSTIESLGYNIFKVHSFEDTDAVLTINGVRVVTSKSGLIDFRLLKEVNGVVSVIYELNDVQATANSFTGLNPSKPIELNLIENNSSVNYYFIWNPKTDSEIKPKDTKISCGCSGGDAFSDYVQVVSGTSPDLNTLATNDLKYTRGFVLDISAKCETGKIICKEYSNENAVAITMANMVRFLAGADFIAKILNSGKVNRFTLMNADVLKMTRQQFLSEYENRLVWLSQNIEVTNSDCFICRQSQLSIGTIFS